MCDLTYMLYFQCLYMWVYYFQQPTLPVMLPVPPAPPGPCSHARTEPWRDKLQCIDMCTCPCIGVHMYDATHHVLRMSLPLPQICPQVCTCRQLYNSRSYAIAWRRNVRVGLAAMVVTMRQQQLKTESLQLHRHAE